MDVDGWTNAREASLRHCHEQYLQLCILLLQDRGHEVRIIMYGRLDC